MNSLTYILSRFLNNPPMRDPILLDPDAQSRFNSWQSGFDAFDRGLPITACPLHGRARPLWRDGWNASKRIEDLITAQRAGGNNQQL